MINEDERGETVDQNRSSLARELARINLTLNTYTQWYWKINLHNLLHFLRLREIRIRERLRSTAFTSMRGPVVVGNPTALKSSRF
jgi:hypothetical protein